MAKSWDKPDYFPLKNGGKRYTGSGNETNAVEGFAKGVNFESSSKARDTFIAFMTEIMVEALRVLKPGGHALVWSLPRTSHWTGTALEDAGFEIRDVISHFQSPTGDMANFLATLDKNQQDAFYRLMQSQEVSSVSHLFGSGFPKSQNISKMIDQQKGMKREIIGEYRVTGNALTSTKDKGGTYVTGAPNSPPGYLPITAPATPEAQQWDGYGTNLKPSVENWLLVRKPLAEKTIAQQVLATGTGGLNIDATRISTTEYLGIPTGQPVNAYEWSNHPNPMLGQITGGNAQGRFPANTLLSHSPSCIPLGEQQVKGITGGKEPFKDNTVYAKNTIHPMFNYADADGMETIMAYSCSEDCPIRILGEQSGTSVSNASTRKNKAGTQGYGGSVVDWEGAGHGDTGTAARYFQNFPPETPPFYYSAKSSTRERNEGLEDLPYKSAGEITDRKDGSAGLNSPRAGAGRTSGGKNTHPTVKNLSLMRYLIRLVTPVGGIVLDPFCGSGSTLVAAVQEHMEFIGVEQELEYVTIANARVAHALSHHTE